MSEIIEIPFGAKDSELGGWEYNIPEGFVASIENGKIIVKKENDEEKVRKEIIELVMQPTWKTEKEFHRRKELCAWLEKQGEQKTFDTDTIKKKAHQIAWEISKHYSLNACKQEWCEMAAIDMASWLEKQDKSKFEQCLQDGDKIVTNEDGTHFNISQLERVANKEPKFKVGDYLVNDYCKGKVIALTDDAYLLDTEQGIPFSCEHNVHLWTIQDAEDGDVLCCESGWTCIFKALDNHTNTFSSYCFMDSDKWFCNTGSEGHTLDKAFIKAYNGEIYPATKEQRDLLFQKMKEAGYEWNVDKKELKKIPSFCREHCKGYQETGRCFVDGECQAKREAEQKPAWSEEDERLCSCLIEEQEESLDNVKNDKYGHSEIISDLKDMYRERIDWLKSLKGRIKPQWKPSDEQIQALEYQVHSTYKCSWQYAASKELLEQLKKL